MSEHDWLHETRALFDDVYDRDWLAHVRALNQRLGLAGDAAFLEVPTTPEFFWGDLAGFRPREWVAVVSLNPQVMSADNLDWQQRQEWSPDALWDYLNRRDLRGWQPKDYYYTRFARPLVMLTRAALGSEDAVRDEVSVLMQRVGLFETAPYPSRVYRLTPSQASELRRSDPGCRASMDIALTAIRRCPPAAVLTNGLHAAEVLAASVDGHWAWNEQRYESSSKPGKWLRHWEAAVESDDGPVPVFGLPHLRTQSSHNSNAEMEQLAQRIRQVVRG